MPDALGGAEEEGDAARSKSRVLADTGNRLLQNLVPRSAREDGVRDYFHVGVVGYGERVEGLVRAAEGVEAVAPELVPISALAERPLRLEEWLRPGPGGAPRRVRTPVWFDPEALNGTPMCRALDHATRLCRAWVDRHPRGLPPFVLDAGDGEATDGDPLRYARELCAHGTSDGDVLVLATDALAAHVLRTGDAGPLGPDEEGFAAWVERARGEGLRNDDVTRVTLARASRRLRARLYSGRRARGRGPGASPSVGPPPPCAACSCTSYSSGSPWRGSWRCSGRGAGWRRRRRWAAAGASTAARRAGSGRATSSRWCSRGSSSRCGSRGARP
jgi:hypothetical protein